MMSDAALSGKRLWIVEDEFLLAAELQMTIEQAGGTVMGPHGDLDEALEAFDEMDQLPDAAVLDIDIDGRDVFPVAKQVHDAGIPFLFNTGHGDREELKARFDGVTVCTKPTAGDELVAAIAELLS